MKYKYTAFYFMDEMDESDGIHFANPNKNSYLCTQSSNHEKSLIDEMKCYKRRFAVMPTKDAIVIFKHLLKGMEDKN